MRAPSGATTRTTPALRLPAGSDPLHERVAAAIEAAIAARTFSPGQRLPTHREISRDLGVAIGTVTRSVDTLAKRGIVRGEIGRGTFVLQRTSDPNGRETVDLSLNAPPPVVDASTLAQAAERASRACSDLPSNGYGDVAGFPSHRSSLSRWLARGGLDIPPDDLIVTVGAQHALALAFDDLAQRMDGIAMESATFTGGIAAASSVGLQLLPVRVDEEGMMPEALDRVLAAGVAKAVYTTPVAQNPLGFEVGAQRRSEILEVCRDRGAYLVEDDVYSVYRRTDALTYRAMAPDLVYYVNGLSKSLSPILRVGVLAPPADRRGDILERLRAELWGASPIAVSIGCELLDVQADVGAANWLRAEASARVAMSKDILSLPTLADHAIPHIWLPMPLTRAESLARRALERGVRVTPPGAPLLEPGQLSGVRLCILAPRERDTLASALTTLAAAMAERETPIV